VNYSSKRVVAINEDLCEFLLIAIVSNCAAQNMDESLQLILGLESESLQYQLQNPV
jgi:hypothetical protein